MYVRYRYDEEHRKRVKTVELIIEEIDWEPHTAPSVDERLVKIRVAVSEVEIRRQVKQAGGTWNPLERVWELRYDRVMALGLADRIVRKGGI